MVGKAYRSAQQVYTRPNQIDKKKRIGTGYLLLPVPPAVLASSPLASDRQVNRGVGCPPPHTPSDASLLHPDWPTRKYLFFFFRKTQTPAIDLLFSAEKGVGWSGRGILPWRETRGVNSTIIQHASMLVGDSRATCCVWMSSRL